MQVCIERGAIRVVEAVVVLDIQEDARPACIAKACDSVDASAIAFQESIVGLPCLIFLHAWCRTRCKRRYPPHTTKHGVAEALGQVGSSVLAHTGAWARHTAPRLRCCALTIGCGNVRRLLVEHPDLAEVGEG